MLQAGGWLALYVSMVLSRVGAFSLEYLMINKLIFVGLGIAVTIAMRKIYQGVRQKSPGLVKMIVISVVCSYAFATIWTVSFEYVIYLYQVEIGMRAAEVESWGFLVRALLYHVFMLLAWSILYFAIKYRDDMILAQQRMIQAELSAQEARLKTLRYQLNPHFLFNTLNAISTLVNDKDSKSANKMISRLSDFLRLTLDGKDTVEVPLISELEYAQHYLKIEEVRFGDRLEVEIDIPVDVYGALVPNLILQPLLENAIKHGISPREDGGRISLTAKKLPKHLVLVVKDDGAAPSTHISQNGVGLANIRQRLEELYTEDYDLAISSENGFEVTITIPFRVSDASSEQDVVVSDSATQLEPTYS